MAHVSACLVAAAVAAAAVSALPLPSYIKPCKLNDPAISDCIVKNGREAIPAILKGDPKYHVPQFEPLVISEVSIAGSGLNITMRNVRLFGLRDIDFRSARFDPKAKHFEWDFFLPRLEVLSDYTVSGKVLVLPITGSGPGNLTLVDVPLTMSFDYEISKKGDGKEYFHPTSVTPTFDTKRVYIDLKNLFNGNKLLGENTNKFLNENWRAVTTDVGPVLAGGISEALKQLLANIAQLVPYDQLFLL